MADSPAVKRARSASGAGVGAADDLDVTVPLSPNEELLTPLLPVSSGSYESGSANGSNSNAYSRSNSSDGRGDGSFASDASTHITLEALLHGLHTVVPHFCESWTGAKPTNEDRYVQGVSLGPLGHYFSVYDGHGGTECADYVQEHLHRLVAAHFAQTETRAELDSELQTAHAPDLLRMRAELQQAVQLLADAEAALASVDAVETDKEGKPQPTTARSVSGSAASQEDLQSLRDSVQQLRETVAAKAAALAARRLAAANAILAHPAYERSLLAAIRSAFDACDAMFKDSTTKLKDLRSGSTALACLVIGVQADAMRIVLANAGDCRSVLSRGRHAVRLTQDHKPNRPDEEARIQRAGGRVMYKNKVWRVFKTQMGPLLAVSRSFGDYELKKDNEIVTAKPETRVEPLSAHDRFMVIACDGIWDVLSDQEAVDLVWEQDADPERGAAAVVRKAFNKGSDDNLTAMVIAFPWASTDRVDVKEDDFDMFS